MFSVASFNGLVEFSPGFAPRPQISHVIFDFDGTLSWLRHGWPEIMCKLFREHYPLLPGESEEQIHDRLLGEILSLNGKPSICQMQRLVELARERDHSAPSPEDLLNEYQSRLDRVIAERTAQIRSGTAEPDSFIVFGLRPFLEQLKQRKLILIILSGTVEHRVKEEAELLDLARYFGPHIYGSGTDAMKFSKRAVIDRLLREERIEGDRLLSFGDGPVEIEQTKNVGGLAIAVASDENINGSGQMDAYKRRQLRDAGADVLIPDYRDASTLLKIILNE